MDIIKTENLTKKFGTFTANDNINLYVKEKEIKCIVGENGAGKSTLMNMLYGVLKPTSGKIFIRNEQVNFSSPSDAMEHGIGMVHQHFKLVPSLTVFENIVLGTEINKKTKKGIKLPLIDTRKELEVVKKLIEEQNFELDPLAKIEDLSVGARQRVEILKMLYRKVDILILDEPTAVLIPQEVDQLILTLKKLRDLGKTIIVITHKLREVLALSDSVTVIKQGKVTGCVNTKDTNERELAQMMVGRDVVLSIENNHECDADAKTLYEANNITTLNCYGKKCVDNISFQLHENEILGIAGVEGNGQSELVKILTGLMESCEGQIKLDDQDVTNKWPDELRTYGLGIIPEDRYKEGLCKTMSIAENCIAGYHKQNDVCKNGILKVSSIKDRRDQLIKSFDIRVGDIEGEVGQLSGGNAQKIILARELNQNPKVLLACQPTRGVDIGSIEFIHKQLLKYRDEGHGVLLISSELSEIMSLSDRIMVMYKGKIIGEVCAKNATSEQLGLLMAGIVEDESDEK
ncbi:MAG: ABC transporter ATP-binding protein [Pleomorphochaeta sp.]